MKYTDVTAILDKSPWRLDTFIDLIKSRQIGIETNGYITESDIPSFIENICYDIGLGEDENTIREDVEMGCPGVRNMSAEELEMIRKDKKIWFRNRQISILEI